MQVPHSWYMCIPLVGRTLPPIPSSLIFASELLIEGSSCCPDSEAVSTVLFCMPRNHAREEISRADLILDTWRGCVRARVTVGFVNVEVDMLPWPLATPHCPRQYYWYTRSLTIMFMECHALRWPHALQPLKTPDCLTTKVAKRICEYVWQENEATGHAQQWHAIPNKRRLERDALFSCTWWYRIWWGYRWRKIAWTECRVTLLKTYINILLPV